MPLYHDMPDKSFRTSLPSTPGAEVWGPGELDVWSETRILGNTQRTEIDPQGKGVTIVNNALFEYELLHAVLEHNEAGWNLFAATGLPYDRDRVTIDRIFSGAQGRRDRAHLVNEMAKYYFPEMVNAQTEKTSRQMQGTDTVSAEGNDTPASENIVDVSPNAPRPFMPVPLETTMPTEPVSTGYGNSPSVDPYRPM